MDTLFNISRLESLIQIGGTQSDRISRTEAVFTKICRLCLCETAENSLESSLFVTCDMDTRFVTIKEMMEASTGLLIDLDDTLPQHICDDCLKSVEDGYKFRSKCRQIDKILKGFLKQLQTTEDKTETENEFVSGGAVIVPIKSEETDEIIDDLLLEGFEVSYVKEEPIASCYQCHQCQMEFTSQTDLDKHQTEHCLTSNTKQLLNCTLCEKTFELNDDFINHLHGHWAKKRCPHCKKSFDQAFKEISCTKEISTNDYEEYVFNKDYEGAMEPLTVMDFNTSKERIFLEKKLTQRSSVDQHQETDASNITDKLDVSNDEHSHTNNPNECRDCSTQTPTRIISSNLTCTIPECKLEFTYYRDIINHYISHHCAGSPPFKCPICPTWFYLKLRVRNHVKLHFRKMESGQSTLEITSKPLSDDDEPSIDQLKEDYTSTLTAIAGGEFSCTFPECKKYEFKCYRNIINHYLTQHCMGPSPFKCPVCMKSFIAKKDVRNHLKSHVGDMKPSNESIVTFKAEKLHDDALSITDEPPLNDDIPSFDQSEENPRNFVVKKEIMDDGGSAFMIANEPLSDDEPSCSQYKHNIIPDTEQNLTDAQSTYEIDNELFSDDEPSIDHSKEDPTEMEADAACIFTCAVPQCKVEFKYYADIINHYTSQHCRGPPPFKCPVCVMVFPLKDEVRNHLKSHLKCEYKCPYCPIAYWNLNDLNVHLRTHTSELSVKCTKCPKRFKDRAALRLHSKVHTTYKKYKCEICAKEFSSPSGMSSHKKGHMEIKELQCDFCNKQFPTKTRLQRHKNGVCGVRSSTTS